MASTGIIEQYADMGYSEEFAQEARDRFGDDLHAGCHWLMMRETMGRVPKRLKTTQTPSDTTYIGTSIRLSGLNWTITDFDAKHALIRMTSANNTARWGHISDMRIEWIHIRHNDASNAVPKAAWTRNVGEFSVSLAWLDPQRLKKATPSNILDMYIKHGRPSEHGANWIIWRTVSTLSREYVHEPSRPRPKGVSSDEVHRFRVEWMTYFHALCDVHGLSQDTFMDRLYNSSLEKVLDMFPEHLRCDLKVKVSHWQHPKPYLAKRNEEWRQQCLPLIRFLCKDIDRVNFRLTFDVQVHNMTFVQPMRYDAGVHLQLQRLFFVLFPKTCPQTRIQGPMDDTFLNMVLRASKATSGDIAEPNALFQGTLFKYQKRCLRWLLKREKSNSTSSWGWTKHRLADDFVFHTSVFGHIALTPPNNTVRGGLLAQDVGMGKTIEMLALIATNKTAEPTLVVVPTTMLSVWQSEAAERCPTFKVVKFHGARRTRNMDDLRAADIVLTTYRIVVNETQRHIPTIGAIRWGRIILDESHELKHVHTETTKAICRLFSPLRWCVSATPWPKGMVHAASILTFMGVHPFDESPTMGNFSSAQLLLRHHGEMNPTLISKIMTECTWWQQKRHVSLSLPPVSEHDMLVQCDNPELYTRMRDVIKFRLELDGILGRKTTQSRILHYARWLRLLAIHISLNRVSDFAIPSSTDEVTSEYNTVDAFIESLGTTNYDESLKAIVQSCRDGNEMCSICMDALDRPTVTPCNHMFCFECIQTSFHHDAMHRCPLCRTCCNEAPLRELTEQIMPEEAGAKMWRSHDTLGYPIEMDMQTYESVHQARGKIGNKFRFLLKTITGDRQKCIIFTQFHNAWVKVCRFLAEHNIKHVSIDGKMTPKRRATSIETFQSDESTRVFVMTTKTASVGVTLTAASHIIFMEPCHNKHLKKQAIGRAWRIGQTKPITVTTLKSAHTIDTCSPKDILKFIQGLSDPVE
jgi:hypothetical protein